MKVVEPSVSTASRLRTSTFRFAICSAPQASDSVTVGSSASGTSATVTPMAKVNPSAAVSPRTTATRKNTAPTPTAMRATVCTSRRSSRARGPGGAGSAAVRRAISASLVRAPVAVTTASPSPSTTKHPAWTRSPSSTGDGSLSPVRSDVSTDRRCVSVTTASAGMRSPASSASRSSTTTSLASSSWRRPSRHTVTRIGSSAPRRSAARSARCSWTKAKAALSRTTATMATPSSGRSATKASPAATQSMRAKTWTSWSRKRRTADRRRGRGSTFGPSRGPAPRRLLGGQPSFPRLRRRTLHWARTS